MTKLLQTPIVLGGPNKTVEIDESMFRHKPKVRNTAYVEETVFITVSSRSASSTGSMGIRHGGHIAAACVGFYADCSAAGCHYFAAYNTGAYKSWHRDPL